MKCLKLFVLFELMYYVKEEVLRIDLVGNVCVENVGHRVGVTAANVLKDLSL